MKFRMNLVASEVDFLRMALQRFCDDISHEQTCRDTSAVTTQTIILNEAVHLLRGYSLCLRLCILICQFVVTGKYIAEGQPYLIASSRQLFQADSEIVDVVLQLIHSVARNNTSVYMSSLRLSRVVGVSRASDDKEGPRLSRLL